jgi:hypothetical protein
MAKRNYTLFIRIIFIVILNVVSLGVTPVKPVQAAIDGINLWTNGIIPYKFDDGTYGPVAVHNYDITLIEQQMTLWELALRILDPATGQYVYYIDFQPCNNNCSGSYLIIRYNDLIQNGPDAGKEEECNNMPDPPGMELINRGAGTDGITELHFRRGTCPRESSAEHQSRVVPANARTNQTDRVILHELGHVLGLWHAFNRPDADNWLVESPDLDGADFRTAFGTKELKVPALGNYDYDSIMHYGSGSLPPANTFADYLGNTIDKSRQGAVVSKGDISWVLQFYAQERYPKWGFFRSLSRPPQNPDQLPDPYLAAGVTAVGSPTIAYQGSGKYEIFARGSDNRIYWFPLRFDQDRIDYRAWQSIGCCFRSDPSAVSRSANRIDVVSVSDHGEVMRIKYIDGNWSAPLSIRGGPPTGGIKQNANGDYISTAIASRDADSLDVIAVRSDGRLAVSTWENENWGRWHTLGSNYNVTARPAAVALSSTVIQMAINESNQYLYEPSLTFTNLGRTFVLGQRTANIAAYSSPAITKRGGQVYYYRVLIEWGGHIFHRVGSDAWIDVGGIPKQFTGLSAVATGDFTFMAVMNGEDAKTCIISCLNVRNAYIQPGGLWIRDFK